MEGLLTRWVYLWQETWRGLQRGGWMNWAAVGTVAVSLFLFGLSLQASWQVERLLEQFGSQLEISVYLTPGTDAITLAQQLETWPEATAVEVIPRDRAWANLVQELGISDIEQATQQLAGNPLLDELKVRSRSSEVTATLAARIEAIKGVEAAQYVAEAVQRLREVDRALQTIGLGVVGLLVSAAIATIVTTIRLVVAARQREIEIMRLVGATRDWIYLPFVLQGLLFGLQGSALAWGSLLALQQTLRSLVARQATLLQWLVGDLAVRPVDALILGGILVGFGCAVGLVGSFLAVLRTAQPTDETPQTLTS